MHPSAMNNGDLFFRTYVADGNGKKIVEIGSQNVNGSLRDVKPDGCDYVGVDFVEARGVDVVLDPEDPYSLPFEDETVDVIVTSSVLEHSEFFWLLFLELIRVLKPNGILYINAPSYGSFHRYPVDCYRFYPDFGKAMEKWAKRNKFKDIVLLESFVCRQDLTWHDNVSVYLKNKGDLDDHPNRILDKKEDFLNGFKFGTNNLLKPSGKTDPELKSSVIQRVISGKITLNP